MIIRPHLQISWLTFLNDNTFHPGSIKISHSLKYLHLVIVFFSKMNHEKIFSYAILAIVGTVGMIVAYLILKYLNQKPLGMQTIFDQMIKDQIYLTSLWTVFIIILPSIEYMPPFNHNIALTISFLTIMLLLAKIWQFSMILVIRYFSVFYQNIMNSVDENFVKRLVRSFVCIVSITLALISDLENTIVYQTICIRHDDALLLRPAQAPKMVFISAIVCVIILIIMQYQIEMFKKSVDVQAKFDQLEEDNNNQESNRTNYNKNTLRIVLGLYSVGLFFIILILGLVKNTPEYIHLRIAHCIITFINNIVIPVIFIVRNENLCNFCQCQIMKIFKCC